MVVIGSLLLIMILAIAYYAYHLAFRAPVRIEEEQYALPVGEQYDVFRDEIEKSISYMRGRICEEIQIVSYDGKKLFGRYYHVADGAPVQIQFHGYKGSAFRDFCGGSKLAMKMGHNALVVDQRSHGKSDGNTITFGIKERKDCLAWITYVQNRFGNQAPIILSGVSMGAATVLMVNDQILPENVKGIIADCPYSTPKDIIKKVGKDIGFPPNLMYPFVKLGAFLYGHFNLEEMDVLRAVKQAKVPILILHGTDDRFVPHQMSEEIKDCCASSVTLELFPEAGHVLCYLVDAKRYEKVVGDFLESVLG